MKYTDQLFETNPFDFNLDNLKLFRESLKENFNHHFSNSNQFSSIMKHRGCENLNWINCEDDISKMPSLLVSLFKQVTFKTSKDEDIVLTLTSSGTGGLKSQQRLNQESLDRVKKLAYNVYSSLGICSEIPTSYICFTYDPEIAKDLGTAFTDKLLTSFTPTLDVLYAFQWDSNEADFVFRKDLVIQKLRKNEKSKTPTRILGFPAFLYQILKETDIQLNLGKDSWLLTGGGWKNHQDEQIDKLKFRELIEKRLGIPKENCRDLFGMVEHGVPYVDCKDGYFRIPNYSRVYVRDPYTLEPLQDGEFGLLHFICTYNSSYPCLSILSTDIGRVLPSHTNHPAKILEITGRAGVNKHKGCALKALEIKEKNS